MQLGSSVGISQYCMVHRASLGTWAPGDACQPGGATAVLYVQREDVQAQRATVLCAALQLSSHC